MRPFAIEVEIGELVVGMPLGAVDRRRLAAGLEAELGRLLAERPPSAPAEVERIPGGRLEAGAGHRTADIAKALARSVHSAISSVGAAGPPDGPHREERGASG